MIRDDGSQQYGIFARRFTERAHEILAGECEGSADELLGLCDDYSWLMDECRNSLQRRLGAALIFAVDGYNPVKFVMAHEAFGPGEAGGIRPDFGTIVYPHGAIAGHTVDFLFTTWVKGLAAYAVVRCEEQTSQEQDAATLAQGKERDQRLALEGARILSFTAVDIESDLPGCIAEVEEVLGHQIDRLMIQAGISSMPERHKLRRRPPTME